MLGEKIGELTGQVIGTRILPGGDYRYVRMEISVRETGQVCGVDVTDYATYTVFERVPGQLYGEGQGIIEAAEAGAIYNGHGVSRMAGAGMQVAFRFSIAFQAGADGPFARLNNVLVIGEHDVDDQGNTKTTIWEWR